MNQMDNALGTRLLEQLLNLFVYPEIRRREFREELRAAQILFFPDGKKPLVRMNSEVKAIGKVKLRKGVSKEAGDPLFAYEVEGLEEINRLEDDYPDCGHATLIRFGDRWTIAFDFRYNKRLARRHIEAAKQFYHSAEHSLDTREWHPFVDNLFSAAELGAKALLLSMPAQKLESHRAISATFNRFADLGNIQPEHKRAFNKLYGAREDARYLRQEVAIQQEQGRELLRAVKDMIEYVCKWFGVK